MVDKEISNEDIYALLQSLVSQNNEIKQKMRNINSRIDVITVRVNGTNEQVEKLEEGNRELKSLNEGLGRQAKKYNIVVYGLPKTKKDTLEDVEYLIETLDMLVSSDIEVRDAFRIGKKVEGKIRPIVAQLTTYRMKADILIKSKRNDILQKKGVFISNDYPKKIYQQRKCLHSKLKAAKSQGHTAQITKHNSLQINRNIFSYQELVDEEEENQREISSAPETHKPSEAKRKDREKTPEEARKLKPKISAEIRS
ncbi:unnamed protein product [Phaedon cochleariae]|uniref:Endonuclease-reverse transcriptase n=1 Tax=Phaedon cochleariae TaxID=80249 RepID=A0A9N9SHY0_PHACE|nr:unnamed protein product [Phaedon cochleariae]